MTLQQIFDFVQKKTYFSREDDEIWDAISEAASTLFLKVTSENSGFFLKWDTTSVSLQPNVDDYALPADLGQMIRMRERLLATDDWKVILPADINAPSFVHAQFASLFNDSGASSFRYYGPLLLMDDAKTAAQVQHVKIAPIPQDTRFVELVYDAKFLEITGPESVLVIPSEGHGAVKFAATADLLAANDDDNAERYTGKAAENERWFLKWVRNRQFQQGRQVEPYVSDLD
jgi:hypothetical protein